MHLIRELTVSENVLLAYPNQIGEHWNVLLPNNQVKAEEEWNKSIVKSFLTKIFIDYLATSKAGELSYWLTKTIKYCLLCCKCN
jgi:ABC-type branched-subunit amino acid transport system ATPase component